MRKHVKITAELVTARDLQPGELFSIAGPSYWNTAMSKDSIGECVYVRTNADPNHASDANSTVYRITIERSEAPKLLFTEEPTRKKA